MRYALVRNGIVDNVAEGTPEHADAVWRPQYEHVIELDDQLGVGPGWSYDGQNFAPPPEPVYPESEPPPPDPEPEP